MAGRVEMVLQALSSLAVERPVSLTVCGDCMEPIVGDGARVEVAPRALYWPGDVVAFGLAEGRLRVHRVIGYRLRARRLCLLTQGDAAPVPDAPVARRRVIGRLVGGHCSPRGVEVPLRDRLRAVLRFITFLARRLRARAAGPGPMGRR